MPGWLRVRTLSGGQGELAGCRKSRRARTGVGAGVPRRVCFPASPEPVGPACLAGDEGFLLALRTQNTPQPEEPEVEELSRPLG